MEFDIIMGGDGDTEIDPPMAKDILARTDKGEDGERATRARRKEEGILEGYIHGNDINGARKYFDDCFWQKKIPSVTWDHLKSAVRCDDLAMVKLLMAWGARAPNKQAIEDFYIEISDGGLDKKGRMKKYVITHSALCQKFLKTSAPIKAPSKHKPLPNGPSKYFGPS